MCDYYFVCGVQRNCGSSRHLPCAAPFKSLQGVAVPFSFFLVSNGILNF